MRCVPEVRSKDSIDIALCSLDDTRRLAGIVAEHVSGGIFIGLSGPLGVGKTEFVRALADSLGVNDEVSSPSFVLEAVYNLREDACAKTLHHWDLYRLNDEAFCPELFDYEGDPDKVVVIEWPEKVSLVGELLSFVMVLGFPDSECENMGEEERFVSFCGVDDQRLRQRLEAWRTSAKSELGE